MPHFISKNMFVKTNATYNTGLYDIKVMDYLSSIRFPYLKILPILVDDDVMFIRCIQRDKDILYKVDKLTRPADLKKIKNILSFLSKDLDILSHNLNPTHRHTRGMQKGYFLKQDNLSSIKPDIIEIGFGTGRHILDLADKHKQKTILGFEIHQPSIRQVLNAIELHDIKNLYICDLDARLGIQMFDNHSVESIYLHFPIPWNHAKHRRIMSRDFVENSFKILRYKGYIDMRSDDAELIQDCIQEMLSANGANFNVRKNRVDSGSVVSKYENRWVNLKKDIYEIRIINDNHEQSLKEEDSLYFDFDICIESLRPFSNKKWVENGIFISIGDVYIGAKEHDISIAHLAFGSFYIPFNTYLVLENNRIHYLRKPINVKSHRLAHEFLCKILNKG